MQSVLARHKIAGAQNKGTELMMRIYILLLSLAISCIAIPAGAQTHPIERQLFEFNDGGESIYYMVELDRASNPDSIIFFYGGSGCISWRDYLPVFSEEIGIDARYLALNKRNVDDSGRQLDKCGDKFHETDNLRQWMSDYMEFISTTLKNLPVKPRNVVLVGISEGGMVAARVARARSDITHLIVIGDGGWSMRENLGVLMGPEAVSREWPKIASDPSSIEKSWLGNTYRYWFDVMDYSPIGDYLALEIPVLIAIGERDKSVPSASALDVQKSATASGKKNIGVVVYPGADHLLRAGDFSYRAEFLRQAGKGVQEGISP